MDQIGEHVRVASSTGTHQKATDSDQRVLVDGSIANVSVATALIRRMAQTQKTVIEGRILLLTVGLLLSQQIDEMQFPGCDVVRLTTPTGHSHILIGPWQIRFIRGQWNTLYPIGPLQFLAQNQHSQVILEIGEIRMHFHVGQFQEATTRKLIGAAHTHTNTIQCDPLKQIKDLNWFFPSSFQIELFFSLPSSLKVRIKGNLSRKELLQSSVFFLSEKI